MKNVYPAIFLVLSGFSAVNAQSGADCANAIPLTLDGVVRSYATSSSTGSSQVCTSYTGAAPITYFSFTTNAASDKVLMDITAPTAEPCEVALYTSNCGVLYFSGSMCFDDGQGLWSFSQSFSILPNTTYKLRIRTTTAGNITIGAKFYNPPNNNCSGAFPISATMLSDNNACHLPGTEVTAAQLCATTLENTAFYKYTVMTDDVTIINISNIDCDNGNLNNSSGFQIGFFTGSCGAMTPLTCFAGSGNFVTATTPVLTAGTDVIVAIDGAAGSNCSYDINVINGYTLATGIIEFNGWKTNETNLLKWTTTEESAGNYYEVQRSVDGRNFYTIGQVTATTSSSLDVSYQYEDNNPPVIGYYRLKLIETGGKSSMTKIVELRREAGSEVKIELNNPVRNTLNMRIITSRASDYQMNVFNAMGQSIYNKMVKCNSGVNSITESFAQLPAGSYYVVLNSGSFKTVAPFIKLK